MKIIIHLALGALNVTSKVEHISESYVVALTAQQIQDNVFNFKRSHKQLHRLKKKKKNNIPVASFTKICRSCKGECAAIHKLCIHKHALLDSIVFQLKHFWLEKKFRDNMCTQDKQTWKLKGLGSVTAPHFFLQRFSSSNEKPTLSRMTGQL